MEQRHPDRYASPIILQVAWPESLPRPCILAFLHGSQLRYPPLLDPKLESAAAELAGIMKSLAGLRDAVEADRAAGAGTAADGGEGQGASATDPNMKARMDSLHSRLREIVGEGNDDGVAASAGLGEVEGSDEEDAEEDSEAGSDGDDEPLEMSSGACPLHNVTLYQQLS